MLVDTAEVDQRYFVGTYAACSRSEAGNVHIVAEANTHFRPLDTYIRGNCIAITIPSTKIENSVFLELSIVAGVQDETYRSAYKHLGSSSLALEQCAGI